MDLTDSHKLLRDYADRGNESAFQELVNRYIDLVYSTALRRVGGNADTAQDVTQAVFTDLARKAQSLRGVDMLGGWLHRHTGFVASNLVRSEQRRQIREQEAAQMNALTDSPDALWQQLSPVLDETIDSLEPADRQAILLRFFERHDFRSIGATFGISDDAAQKRVSRALEKLKDLLARRGVTLNVVLLGTFMAGKVVKAAPAGLAAKVAGLALAGATASAGLAATLANVANSLTFKIALAAIVVATAAKLILSSHSAPTVETARQGNAAVLPVGSPTAGTAAPAVQVPNAPLAPQSASPSATSNILALTIVSADSGQPVPNVQLDISLWVEGKVKRLKPLQATPSGTCDVQVPDGTTELILVSEVEGFADTRLKWEPDHGQVIPAQYTLRIAHAVPIGGRVLDPDGNPVAGAEVGFNNQPDPAVDAHIETDDFGWPFWITAKTDAQGHWEINRIGKAATGSIYGSASHPDFVGSTMLFAARDPNAEKQLLAGAWVFSLGHAVTVRGIVQDPNGQPIPGARILVGHVGDMDSRQTNSQDGGAFSVSGCQPGKNVVTAEAKGYAATTLDVDLADNSTPIQLILKPGNLLKLKVVDPDGNPVPKATAWLNTFGPENLSPTSATPAQVDFNRSTDADGRLEWDSAPDGELTFAVSARDYMRSDNIPIRADGTEHVITLQPGLTISGSVTDAATGQPVPRFRIITGWPEHNPFDGTTNARWSPIDRFWLTFDGGKFEHTCDEPAFGGTSNIEFMFKFEAEGYMPFVTRVVQAAERNVELNVALTPATSNTVTVLLPNAQPAAGAEIGLVGYRSGVIRVVGLSDHGAALRLIPGGFAEQNQTSGSVIKADAQGHFQMVSDPEVTRVIAATPDGYAEATPAELTSNPILNLQPWGRLEGTCLSGGQPAANKSIRFQLSARLNRAIECDFTAFQTKTDSEGRFVFAQVPPGDHELVLLLQGTNNDGLPYRASEPLRQVTVQPGETTSVSVDTPGIPNNPPPTANR